MIDHATAYIADRCHTNALENFWSLLKRSINGTYVMVDARHLERYVDEQVFRFNERTTNAAGRFAFDRDMRAIIAVPKSELDAIRRQTPKRPRQASKRNMK